VTGQMPSLPSFAPMTGSEGLLPLSLDRPKASAAKTWRWRSRPGAGKQTAAVSAACNFTRSLQAILPLCVDTAGSGR